METPVEFNEDLKRFLIRVGNKECILMYRMPDEKTIDIYRTYVPEELRGGRLGYRLVKAALEKAREMGWKVIPSCSFAENFIERNKEYRDLVSE